MSATDDVVERPAPAQPRVKNDSSPTMPTATEQPDERSWFRVTEQRDESSPTSPLLIPAPPLASSRYNRQLLLPQLRLRGQEYLLSSKVLIVGLGGLGSPAALYLAGAGIGTLGFMDGDAVEVSNLHRQIVHTEDAARAGLSKVRSAAARCKALNSEISYVCHDKQATGANILATVAQYDLVLDCTDNPASRYLISDACVILGKVLISGAAQRGEGMLIVLNSPPPPPAPRAGASTGVATGASEGAGTAPTSTTQDKGPCYRCVFPRPPAPETVRSCSEIGILGPVVGTIGTLMAGEAIKVISTGGHLPPSPVTPTAQGKSGITTSGAAPERHTMLLYNTWATDPRSVFRTITLRGRRKDCLACGDDETLAQKNLTRITPEMISQGRLDYGAFCGVADDVRLLGEENRINASEFLEEHARRQHRGHGHHGETRADEGTRTRKRKRKAIVVDVREEHEFELGPKVGGSVNIPLSRILRHGDAAFDQLGIDFGTSTGISHPGGMVDQEWKRRLPTTEQEIVKGSESEADPQGGQINKESHIPITEGANVNSHSAGHGQTVRVDLAFLTESSATGPDGGMLNRESHIRAGTNDGDNYQGSHNRPDEEMVNHETHIPLAAAARIATSTNSAGAGPDGGMVDDEAHSPISEPVARQSTFSSANFPSRPGEMFKGGNEDVGYNFRPGDDENNHDDDDDDEPPDVYFVCQRGNDSQIAAQKLMTSIQTVQDATGRETATATATVAAEPKARRQKVPWIGDIKGGFLALEQYAAYQSP
ncbi:hypothetical protein G647_01255 [Cladophialophora carrionii CBS 160.54]|uniref:Rhodanese domain-containing protein n=1 Tax=Cladophialophora carrionii CBS 160.54 TaxID=1279043 RepID=V9DR52_9EURO|nr:uncharacterized protein G647_01255 [Cladophialophora carrionii CBS 160.54]ETI28803.1 hypothetical protein G647_01255 [Cladophialophora carrionii CBS 160.54]